MILPYSNHILNLAAKVSNSVFLAPKWICLEIVLPYLSYLLMRLLSNELYRFASVRRECSLHFAKVPKVLRKTARISMLFQTRAYFGVCIVSSKQGNHHLLRIVGRTQEVKGSCIYLSDHHQFAADWLTCTILWTATCQNYPNSTVPWLEEGSPPLH